MATELFDGTTKMKDRSVGDTALAILIALLQGNGGDVTALSTYATDSIAAAKVIIAADNPAPTKGK